MRIFRLSALILLAITLSSCAYLEKTFPAKSRVHDRHHAKNEVKSAKTGYPAAAYIEHLTLAKIALRRENADMGTSNANLEIIQQKRMESARQMVVVLDYKAAGAKKIQHILAPLVSPPDFPGLQTIMDSPHLADYTLHDIKVAGVVIPGGKQPKFTDMGVNEARQAIDQQQRRLMETARKPAPLDDARMQLALARFFMEHGFRDAAYLATDNVKQLLAVANREQPEDNNAIHALSGDLESFESQLHKTMPFGL